MFRLLPGICDIVLLTKGKTKRTARNGCTTKTYVGSRHEVPAAARNLRYRAPTKGKTKRTAKNGYPTKIYVGSRRGQPRMAILLKPKDHGRKPRRVEQIGGWGVLSGRGWTMYCDR